MVDCERSLKLRFANYDHGGPNRAFLGARSERYRLVWNMEHPDDGELYDHRSDAGELDNLWGDPAHFAVRAALMAQVVGSRRALETGGQFATRRAGADRIGSCARGQVERSRTVGLLMLFGRERELDGAFATHLRTASVSDRLSQTFRAI